MSDTPTSSFPRRHRMQHWTPAERAIQDAVDVVERAGAHLYLTEAVTLLGKARDKVADFVDGVPELARLPASEPPSDRVRETLLYQARDCEEWAASFEAQGVSGDDERQRAADLRSAADALATLAALRAEVERAVLECNAAVKLINEKVRERDAARAEVERFSAERERFAERAVIEAIELTVRHCDRQERKRIPMAARDVDYASILRRALKKAAAPPAEGPG